MKNITDKFQFSIVNGRAVPTTVAIAHGNIDVEGFVTTATTENNTTTYSTVKHNHNTTNLVAEGFNVDTVLDDATVAFGNTNVVMAATGTGRSIAHALAYLKHNPRMVKNIAIVVAAVPQDTDKSAAFMSMSLASLSPFHKEAAREVDLQQYFSENQFQSGKINIPKAKGELEWNDFLYWDIVVNTGTTLNITIEFWDED